MRDSSVLCHLLGLGLAGIVLAASLEYLRALSTLGATGLMALHPLLSGRAKGGAASLLQLYILGRRQMARRLSNLQVPL